ncbi:MAG TPA: nucleotidyltransferase [Halanaerobiales bacterium]|nr:nucleotidyltransferase [Halanaerobiales bacterium]
MKVLGIITEYNPFHYGHLYHLQEAKKISKANYTICIMNGNFVQRGRPAFINKWTRTMMALKNGVDLIIELPLIYGIRSAEYFADGSIQLLNATGLVSDFVFGSETGEIEILKEIAKILNEKNQYFNKRLKIQINKGYPYPAAREKALIDYLSTNNFDFKNEKVFNIIRQPNNILGIEYIKALLKSNSTITAHTIKRKGSTYHSLKTARSIASATAIRKYITENGLNSAEKLLPLNTMELLKREFSEGRTPIKEELLDSVILAKLRAMPTGELQNYAEINDSLENRIIQAAHIAGSLKTITDKIMTKAFTRTRIQRNLLHILFDLKEKDFAKYDQEGPQYIRVLGVNKKGIKLLSELSENSSLPVIIKVSNYLRNKDIESRNLIEKSLSYDLLASDIYSLLYPDRKQRMGNNDYSIPLIKIDY